MERKSVRCLGTALCNKSAPRTYMMQRGFLPPIRAPKTQAKGFQSTV